MNFRPITALAAFLCVSLAACYPYDESRDRRRVQKKPENTTVSSAEQQKIQAQREELKKKEEAAKKEEPKEIVTVPDTTVVAPTEAPKPTVEEKKPDIPVANKVPGKDGYVFSPFNNKLIDVRGYAPGTLVADPTYPESAKKHFRVP